MKLGLTIRPKYEHDGPCRAPGFIFTPRRPIAITTSSPHVHVKEGGDAFLCVDRPGSSKRPMTRATSGHGQPIAPTWPRRRARTRFELARLRDSQGPLLQNHGTTSPSPSPLPWTRRVPASPSPPRRARAELAVASPAERPEAWSPRREQWWCEEVSDGEVAPGGAAAGGAGGGPGGGAAGGRAVGDGDGHRVHPRVRALRGRHRVRELRRRRPRHLLELRPPRHRPHGTRPMPSPPWRPQLLHG